MSSQYYRCILLVPDIYNRPHIKEIVNMLLLNMGFSGITQTNIYTITSSSAYKRRTKPSSFSIMPLPCVLPCVCVYVCSNHRAPGVCVCYIWQWVEQCLCRGCRRPEDQSLLCRGRGVPPELKVKTL